MCVLFDPRGLLAALTECPMAEARFATSEVRIQIGEAYLQPGRLAGWASSGGHGIEWRSSYEGIQARFSCCLAGPTARRSLRPRAW